MTWLLAYSAAYTPGATQAVNGGRSYSWNVCDLSVSKSIVAGIVKRHRANLSVGFLPLPDSTLTWTLEAGIGLSDTGRDYGLGWRLVQGGSSSDGGSLELSFEARRRESANDDTPPVLSVGGEGATGRDRSLDARRPT